MISNSSALIAAVDAALDKFKKEVGNTEDRDSWTDGQKARYFNLINLKNSETIKNSS